MSVFFISDLHLEPGKQARNELFHHWLETQARLCSALYILGDLFEYWLGDDIGMLEYENTVTALDALSRHGVKIYIMPGNRDFLLGEMFARACGAHLLQDPECIALFGEPTIITHGDLLCTADRAYQHFRRIVRNPWLQRRFTRLPKQARDTLGKRIRSTTTNAVRHKPLYIMDVDQATVSAFFCNAKAHQMIHGHIHRPGIFHHDSLTRIVLGAWGDEGSALRCDGTNPPRFETITA